jgi:hypothetical protein
MVMEGGRMAAGGERMATGRERMVMGGIRTVIAAEGQMTVVGGWERAAGCYRPTLIFPYFSLFFLTF